MTVQITFGSGPFLIAGTIILFATGLNVAHRIVIYDLLQWHEAGLSITGCHRSNYKNRSYNSLARRLEHHFRQR